MRWILLIVFGIVILFVVLRVLVARVSMMPRNLGVENGRLAPCPNTPNCVSTFATDAEHGMVPLTYDGNTAVAQERLVQINNQMARTRIITNTPGYLHVEYRSLIWGFVDDVEYLFDEENGLIHFRSAARLGREDLNVNRERMERIRRTFEEETP